MTTNKLFNLSPIACLDWCNGFIAFDQYMTKTGGGKLGHFI